MHLSQKIFDNFWKTTSIEMKFCQLLCTKYRLASSWIFSQSFDIIDDVIKSLWCHHTLKMPKTGTFFTVIFFESSGSSGGDCTRGVNHSKKSRTLFQKIQKKSQKSLISEISINPAKSQKSWKIPKNLKKSLKSPISKISINLKKYQKNTKNLSISYTFLEVIYPSIVHGELRIY